MTSVLLLGHGSHLNPRSSEPTRKHAERLRRSGRFDEVRVGFWKEEPSFRNALRTVGGGSVYAVPVFTAEGYFVDEVIPRELGLPRDGVTYTRPIGTHPSMTGVIEDRARSAYGDDTEDAALVLVGHGTERNPKSADAVYRHAERVRDRGGFSEVRALFMDEPPFIDDLDEHVDARDVVVVPFFIADGYHTQEDIPEDMGIADGEGGYGVPAEARGKRVWYTGAVGTEAGVVDVVTERVEEAEEPEGVHRSSVSDAEERFLNQLNEEEPTVWGEAVVLAGPEGYELRHADDIDEPPECLDTLGPSDLGSVTTTDDDGVYRPMSGEETLSTGWRIPSLSADELLGAVRRLYPASIENAYLEAAGELGTTAWEETAGRQTGIYAGVERLRGDDLRSAAEAVCGSCVKSRLWGEEGRRDDRSNGSRAESTDAGEDGRIPCREACSFFVAGAREFVGSDVPEGSPEGDEPRRGELSDPANVYRKRYREAKMEGSG